VSVDNRNLVVVVFLLDFFVLSSSFLFEVGLYAGFARSGFFFVFVYM